MEGDVRQTPEFIWKHEHPEEYQRSLDFQQYLMTLGIAWHNPLANECTPDFGCCRYLGEYKIRINRHGEYRNEAAATKEGRIPKKDLVHGASYLNLNKGRGMKVGRWESNKNCFLCIKGPKYGRYEVYEMPHFEDDDGSAMFEPIQRVN